jgi:hypothetical protein
MKAWKYWKNDMGICAVGPDGRNPVARVFDEGEQGGRVAALISAAPDLLNGCAMALEMLRDPESDYLDAAKLETLLEQAIIKARGGG